MPPRSAVRRLAAAALILGLAACGTRVAAPPTAQQAAPLGVPPLGVPTLIQPIETPPGVDAAAGVPGGPEALPAPSAPQLGLPAGAVPVAFLAPLTGPSGPVGRALVEAAQIALFDAAEPRLVLLPRDTGGTPEGAARAAEAALAAGARLILGPLLRAEAEAVKPIARTAGVSVIAFSTFESVAGDGTFLLSFLPRDEVRRVVSYAAQSGLVSFAGLVPGDEYGELVASALREAATAAPGTVERVEIFDPAAPITALSGPVQRLARGGKPGFQALMVGAGGSSLRALAPLLAYNDIASPEIRLLGTGRWDQSGLGTEPALVGAWFAAPPPEARAEFERRFQALYKRRPPRLATLGYDAAALAAALVRLGSLGPEAIAAPSGFAGLDGLFRFEPNGLVRRGLAVLEVKPGNAVPEVVSPAPESFEAAGF